MKTYESPVEEFPGSVTMPDYLTFPQAVAYEEAIQALSALENPSSAKVDSLLLPAIEQCVEKWDIEGVENGKIPATPRVPSGKLVSWLFGIIRDMYNPQEGEKKE
jgi:hypothetical protein